MSNGAGYIVFGFVHQPTGQPSSQPSSKPTAPSHIPSVAPSIVPSMVPMINPSADPSVQSTVAPSWKPSAEPTITPSAQPSASPTLFPTLHPTCEPSVNPTRDPTLSPSVAPIADPTVGPSAGPTIQPSRLPTVKSTALPSGVPTAEPTDAPSQYPSFAPSAAPSVQPTSQPSTKPTAPTTVPSPQPTSQPTGAPSISHRPTSRPTAASTTSKPTTLHPSVTSTIDPSANPTAGPTCTPSSEPTISPSTAPKTSNPIVDPTVNPSVGPTSGPSVVPTLMPTTVVPTELPTLEPTASPTETPSPGPTASPTASPTATPTASPSVAPTLLPTAAPTRVPTRKPSVAPTVGPTVTPTILPTVLPGRTQNPSRAPTAAPSLSEEALWRLELAEILATAPTVETLSVSHRSSYYELNVASASPSTAVYGSCSDWRSLLNDDIYTSKYLYQPVYIALTVQQSLSDGVSTLRCEDVNVVSQLLSDLTNTGSVAGNIVSYECANHTWVVSKCAAGAGVPSLCVNCADPCSTASHCAGSTSGLSTSPFSISPCVNTACAPGTSLVSGIRVLSVAYTDFVPAPSFLSRSVQSTTTSLAVTAQLSAPGSVYCAAYVLNPQTGVVPAPTSTSDLILQNFVGSTDATNTTVVTISGLQSATDFLVYCLSVSRSGSVQALSDVLAQPLAPSTTCCIPIVVQTASSSVRERQPFSNFLTMTVNARPSIDVVVSVHVFDSAGVQVLPVAVFPATFAVNALSATTATFGMRSTVLASSPQMRIQAVSMTSSLLALPVGNYTFAVSIAGESGTQYVASYMQSSRNILVQAAVTPMPAPVLSSAVFADDGSYVAISFDANTDRGKTSTQFPC
eukprot:gene9230-10886_t